MKNNWERNILYFLTFFAFPILAGGIFYLGTQLMELTQAIIANSLNCTKSHAETCEYAMKLANSVDQHNFDLVNVCLTALTIIIGLGAFFSFFLIRKQAEEHAKEACLEYNQKHNPKLIEDWLNSDNGKSAIEDAVAKAVNEEQANSVAAQASVETVTEAEAEAIIKALADEDKKD